MRFLETSDILILVHYIAWHSLFETGLIKFVSLYDKALGSFALLFWLPTLSRSSQVFCLTLLTLVTGNDLITSLVIYLSDVSPGCSTVFTKDFEQLNSYILLRLQNLIWLHRLVGLTLILAFLYAFLYALTLNSLLLASCLPFANWIAFGTVTFHVWHFIISCRWP